MFIVYLLFGLYAIPNNIECSPSEASSSKVMAYDKQWLLLINQIPMAKSGPLTQRQIKLLSENEADLENEQQVYGEKMKELKCIYGCIFQGIFNYTDTALKDRQIKDEDIVFNSYKELMAKIFSALQLANDRAYPWMWQVYFLLYAADDSNPANNIKSTYETDIDLKGEIVEFIKLCISQKYVTPLSSTSVTVTDWSGATNAEKMVAESLTDGVEGQNQWDYAYQNANRFAVDQVLLEALKADNKFDQGRMNEFHSRVRDRLFTVWNAPKSDLYLKKVDLIGHHTLITTLIQTSIAHFVWMHLYSLNLNKSTADFQTFMKTLETPLKVAVSFLDTHSDQFYNDLLSDIQKNIVSEKTLPNILTEAKDNFVKHFNSLSVRQECTDDVNSIENKTKIDIITITRFATGLEQYVNSQKLTNFSFKLIDFYKLSQSPN